MGLCWQGVIWQGLLSLLALIAAQDLTTRHPNLEGRGFKKFGDRCNSTTECGFQDSICDTAIGRCQCDSEYPVTNQIDKCGRKAQINESCFFNEQCEAYIVLTECRDNVCACRYEREPAIRPDGTSECIPMKHPVRTEEYVAPTMIGILVAMALMFIIICVVLRLFSRARWSDNRTIFNTPNPRLMNVSLLRDSKILHQERRGSRGSVRGPSRQPSMASLRAHSPNSQGRLVLGSRRGSRGSSNASIPSNKSPPRAGHTISSNAPMLESVTVEIQEPNA